jgi:hypothetical protein
MSSTRPPERLGLLSSLDPQILIGHYRVPNVSDIYFRLGLAELLALDFINLKKYQLKNLEHNLQILFDFSNSFQGSRGKTLTPFLHLNLWPQ